MGLYENSKGNIPYSVLLSFVIRNEDNELDFEHTMKKFADRLLQFESAIIMENRRISSAVNEVFDKFPRQTIVIDAVVSYAVGSLNPTPENHSVLSERIKDWIRTNADKPGDAPGTRPFAIIRGKNGGVKRWKDFN